MNSSSESEAAPKAATPLHFLVSYTAEETTSNINEPDMGSQLAQYYNISINTKPPYSETHKMWAPQIEREELSHILSEVPTETPKSKSKVFASALNNESFINYLDTSFTIGEKPLPSFLYHTSCELNDVIYIMGGCVALHPHNDTTTDQLDLSKVVLKKGLDLPLPVDSEILNHPRVVPNDSLYVLSSITNFLTKPVISGDIPPPLLSMSASAITKRHIFYYGGYEIVDNVSKDGDYLIINDKQVILNNHGYVLDVVTRKFQRFDLTAHPNLITRYPLTVPRFGHSSTAIHTEAKPATVYIMGGYRMDDETHTFEAIRDLWKLELSIAYEGDNDYIEFGDIVLATPIAPIGSPPRARAFHAMYVYRSNIIFHGGTNGSEIFGDIWEFDTHNETWTQFETKFKGKPVQLKNVAHQAIILDKYFVPLAGSIPADFGLGPNSESRANGDELMDISDLYRTSEQVGNGGTNSLFYYVFCFNLKSRCWDIQRVYHDYHIPLGGKEDVLSFSGCSGSTVTTGDSRTLIIGGHLKANPKNNMIGKSHILNSGLISLEFPLGCSVSH